MRSPASSHRDLFVPDCPAMTIPLTGRYLLAFWCLGALMGISHELAHHVAGFAICGEWGFKTFNSFVLANGCRANHPQTFWLATLAGPVLFNYVPMWIGWVLMRKRDAGTQLFGVSLVFSTIPIMRIVFALMSSNDEMWMIRHHFGNSRVAFWVTNACIWSLTLPPLWLAWRTIRNRFKPLVYLLFLLGVPVLVFYIVGIVLEDLIITQHVLADTVWGMPYMVLLAEVLATIGYAKLKSHLWRSAGKQTPESVRRDGTASPA
jgi:hypothetical protein